ncbi:MAG: ATP-binding protein, partial [Treponema sp.]|nr:ATP-binding protein [Treponema sp.]
MKKNIWKNLEIKIGLMLLFVAVIASIGIYLINYTQFYSLTMNNLKQDAISLHGYAEEAIDIRIFTEINTIEDQQSELYINTHRQLDGIRRIANAKFLYTIKLNDNNEYIYLIDGLDNDDENFSHAGMLVEDEYLADLDRNMEDLIITSNGIMVTDYGYLFSMSFPFHDNDGNVIGVIGIDYDSEHLYHSINRARRMSIIFTLFLGVFFTVATLFFVKRVVKHTEKAFIKMEREINEAHERTKLMLDSSPLCTQIWDKKLNTVDCNEAAVKQYGFKNKQEYLDNFIKVCSPEYQPDGCHSGEKAMALVNKAFEDGYCNFEWMHQLPDGTPMPAEVTLVRIKYFEDDAVAGYTRDLREHYRMMAEIKRHDEIMQAVNNIASLLLTVDSNDDNKALLVKSLGIIGRTTYADRVHIWKNEMTDGKMHHVCTHSWFSKLEEKNAFLFSNFSSSYDDKHSWKQKLMRDECINSLFTEMIPEEKEYVQKHGFNLKSLTIVPLFLEDHFWGFFSIDHCEQEYVFNEEEIEILRSVGLMIVAEINRNTMREKIDTAYRHTKILLDRTPLCCQVWDANVNKIECNEEAIRLFGFKDKQDFLKRSHELYPEYQPNGMLSVEKAKMHVLYTFEKGDCGPFDWTYNMLDGTVMPAEVVLKRIKYEDDYVVAGYTRDMREFKKLMQEIEYRDYIQKAVNRMAVMLQNPDRKTFRDTLYQSMSIIAEAVNVDCVYLWKNQIIDGELYCTQIFEWSQNETIFTDGALYKYDEVVPGWEETLSSGKNINSLVRNMSQAEQDHLNPSGILSILVVPMFIDNQFWGFVGFDDCHKERIFTNEEEAALHSASLLIANAFIRHQLLQDIYDNALQLEAAKEAVEQSSQAKSIFLSQMSHEIRTPMNAILGIAEIRLRNDTLCKDAENGFIKIYESGSLLLNIINDILDFSQIDAGKLEIIQKKYNVPDMINSVVQMNRLRFDSKPIEFKLSVDENIPVELIGDELRVKQILNNLLSNAYKYTNAGEICFSIAVAVDAQAARAANISTSLSSPTEGRYKENDENVILAVKISDTGQGMNEAQLNSLYDAYSRFNLDVNSGIAGTGLGMNITKRLIGAMNGKINVESCVGKGTQFTVSLPQKRCGLEVCGSDIVKKLQSFSFYNELNFKKEKIIYKQISEGRVLIVDDININLLIAREMLQPYGLHIETADNGLEAVEKIKNDGNYDIVFMDHMMPVMDGLKATKILREAGY